MSSMLDGLDDVARKPKRVRSLYDCHSGADILLHKLPRPIRGPQSALSIRTRDCSTTYTLLPLIFFA